MSQRDEVSPTIKPSDDFYRYANQPWLDAHPIPADKARYGVADVLSDTNLTNLRQLIEAPVADDDPLTVRLVKQFYAAGQDEATVEAETAALVQEVVDAAQGVADAAAVMTYVQNRHAEGHFIIWELVLEPDDKDSRRYLPRVWQGGIGLPERTYYLEDNERFATIREQYHTYLADLFELAGLDAPAERAKRVYDLEYRLSEASNTAVENRDPEYIYHHQTLEQLTSAYGAFDWQAYFDAMGLTKGELNVSQPKFVQAVLDLVADTPVEAWRDYLTVHTLRPLALRLSKPWEDLQFGFYGRVLNGQQELEPRWLRMVRQCLIMLPEPIGRLFVEHYFDADAKAEIKALVEHLQTAFRARLERLDWMSDATKQQALHKLSTFLPLLGYPDKWRSYDDLELGAVYARNHLAVLAFEWRHNASRANDAVDREEWLMSPALVNAYYWPNTNGITFPAAILQPPYFDARGDFAANYGSIGAIIGHELTHGFDDQGSQFDAEGNMHSWWTDDDRAKFTERADRLAKQYDGYEIAGRHLDGKLTLGENIADLGGLHVAYDALQMKLAENGRRDDVDGRSPEQRFFLAFAHSWAGNYRDEVLLQQIVGDPHSPDVFRVNGVVVNMPEFYEAFAVDGGAMYVDPAKRLKIW